MPLTKNITLSFDEKDLIKYLLKQLNDSIKNSESKTNLNDLKIALLPSDIEAVKTLSIKLS